MKHKVIFKKLEAKNEHFITQLLSSSGNQDKKHQDIIKRAKDSGIISKLMLSK